MKINDSPALPRVVSLHLHPVIAGAPLHAVEAIELVEGKGILNEPRYFGKISRRTGGASRRQVSLIEREQISEHAAALGLQTIAPGAVRSNIETLGIKLVELVGKEIEIGEAVLFLYEPRDPCSKMDAICQGLRELMMNQRQGVMAEVKRGGRICVGDVISVVGA
jgi:MOSC domain-containing protein YiiM